MHVLVRRLGPFRGDEDLGGPALGHRDLDRERAIALRLLQAVGPALRELQFERVPVRQLVAAERRVRKRIRRHEGGEREQSVSGRARHARAGPARERVPARRRPGPRRTRSRPSAGRRAPA